VKRQKHEPELMGAREAARTLGCRQTNLRAQVGLPEPYQKVAATTLWRADEIKAFAARRIAVRASRIASTPPTSKAA
jgi:hypothetical protein